MKGKLKAIEQEARGLQQTISTGREMAALAAGRSLKVDPKEIVRQLLKNPKVQRVAMLTGGLMVAASIGKTITQYTFYQSIVSREVKKSLKPISRQLDELQASVDELSRQCEQLQKQLEHQRIRKERQ